MLKTASEKKKGILSASGVAFLQGMEGIIFTTFIFVVAIGFINDNAFGAAVLAGKETLGIIFSIILVGPGVIKSLIKKWRSREGMFYAIAAAFGTSLGNLFYLLAIVNGGPTYGVVLTALYPVLSLIMVKFISKKGEPWLVWVGMGITVLAGMLFMIIPGLVSSKGFNTSQLIGMTLGFFAAFFWAFESIFLKLGMDFKNATFTTKEILITRSVFTTISTWVLIMPVMILFSTKQGPFQHFVGLFSDWRIFLILLVISSNIVVLRTLHVKAIQYLGPKQTAIIDTNNFLVPAIMAIGLQYLPLAPGGVVAYEALPWWTWFLLIPLVLGVFMVIYFHKDKETENVLDNKME